MTTLDQAALEAALWAFTQGECPTMLDKENIERTVRAYLEALPPAEPTYVYDPDDWEATYEWDDRSELVENLELRPGDVKKLHTLLLGPPVFVSDVIISRDEHGDADETEIQYFASEDEARKASAIREIREPAAGIGK